MAEEKKIILAKLDIDVSALLKASKLSKDALSDVIDELDSLKSAGQETSQQYAELFEGMEALTKTLEKQVKALQEMTDNNNELAIAQRDVAKAAAEGAAAQGRLAQSFTNTADAQEKLSTGLENTANLLDEIEDEAEDAADAFSQFNAVIAKANTMIAEADTATASHGKTFNDYKKQFKDSLNDLKFFNGGLGDFISKAQEAGGTGPLIKKSFEGMATGIGGMTRAGLAFIATPLGAAIAAISIVVGALVSYLKNTQDGIDKVNAVTQPMQAIFQSLMGVFQKVGEYLYNAFANPKKTLKELYDFVKQNLINRFTAFGEILEGIMKLDFKKIANGTIQATTGVKGAIDKIGNVAKETGKFFDEAAKKGQRMDALQKELDKGLANYTLKTSKLKDELKAQNRIADDTTKTMAQREEAAKKAVITTREMNALTRKRLDSEIEIMKIKHSLSGATDAEKAQLAELIVKRKEANNQMLEAVTTQSNKIKSIQKEGAAEDKKNHEETIARNQQKLNAAVNLQKQDLELFMKTQGKKAFSMEQELNLARKIADDKLAIAKKEFDIEMSAAKTKEAKLTAQNNLMLKQNDIDIELLEKNKDAAVKNAETVLNEELRINKSRIENGQFLSQDLYNEENARLDKILEANNNFQATRLANGIITEQEYQTEINRIKEENEASKKALKTQRAEDEKAENLLKLENDRIEAGAAFEYDLAARLGQIEQKRTIELSNENLTAEQKRAINIKYDNERKAADKAVTDNKLSLASSTFSSMASILGKESAAGKAMAVAQATIDTYKSAVSAYSSMSGIPIVGPALGAVAAAAAVAAGIANVKKITSTKAPKAEKGALFSIGGRRHSEGGTMFTGADGTQFEAEQGELIGVMNRNAAKHFMAFNDAFPAGGSTAPNYFAGGGIVSREMAAPSLNTDELAMKIAEANRALPSPVVAVQDIISEGNSYVKVREGANF